MRVRVNDEITGKDYLVPNVYSQPPPLLISTDGTPSYGQLMLCETIASFILVLTSLQARAYIARNQDSGTGMILGPLAQAIALAAVQRMFRETSGGYANPAVALGTIIWQEFTLSMDRDNEFSQWTYEYAASFTIGPIAGAALAGVTSNIMEYWSEQMRQYRGKKERLNDSQTQLSEMPSGNSSIMTSKMPQTPITEQEQMTDEKFALETGNAYKMSKSMAPLRKEV